MPKNFFAVILVFFSAPLLFAAAPEENLRQLNRDSAAYYQQGKIQKSIEAAEDALLMTRQFYGEESILTAAAEIRLADLYRNRNDSRKAGELYAAALHIQERLLASEHPDISETLYKLAMVNAFQDQPVEAEILLRRALGIKRANEPKPDDPGLLKILAGLEAIEKSKKRE